MCVCACVRARSVSSKYAWQFVNRIHTSVKVYKCKYKSSTIKSNRGLNFIHPIISFGWARYERKLIFNHSRFCAFEWISLNISFIYLFFSWFFTYHIYLCLIVRLNLLLGIICVIIMKLEHHFDDLAWIIWFRKKDLQLAKYSHMAHSWIWNFFLSPFDALQFKCFALSILI